MALGGNPTAIKPPAVDTVSDFLLSSQFCRFPITTFQVFKTLRGGGVPQASLKSSKRWLWASYRSHICTPFDVAFDFKARSQTLKWICYRKSQELQMLWPQRLRSPVPGRKQSSKRLWCASSPRPSPARSCIPAVERPPLPECIQTHPTWEPSGRLHNPMSSPAPPN